MSFEVYSESDIVYLEIGGVPVAIDAIIEVYINGVLYASLAAMPVHLREVALGLLVGDGLINSLDEVEGISVDGRKLEVKTKIDLPATRRSYDEDCSAIAPPRIRRVNSTLKVDWNTIRSVFLDFNKRTASISKGLSVHSTGIYDVLHRRAVIAHDVSRHTAVLKAIGLALEAG
ncbi:MAG: formate dehydrogenase accessory sulfurtransferase FdhD, partial [Acidilobaceae archaeon]